MITTPVTSLANSIQTGKPPDEAKQSQIGLQDLYKNYLYKINEDIKDNMHMQAIRSAMFYLTY
jgi:hypothetical protein